MCSFRVSMACFLFICLGVNAIDPKEISKDEDEELALLLKLIQQHHVSTDIVAANTSNERAGNHAQSHSKNGSTPHICLANEFRCYLEGTCIQDARRCDGGLDCSDGSDEVNCFECTYDFPNGRLIPTHLVCDGVADCDYGEDEHACKSPCGNWEFPCDEGKPDTTCIPDKWKCDSVPDCPNLADESVRLCRSRLAKCTTNQFQCRHEAFCIPRTWRCDDEDDCGDDSDEQDCDQPILDNWMNNNSSIFAWDAWSEWSACSSECDGEQTRSRKCRIGYCVGNRDEARSCGDAYPCVTEPSSGCGTRVFQKPTGRVVGGRDAQVHEWPWQAQIFRPGRTIPFCGGSLIKAGWVPSAAHCFYTKKFRADEYFVALGRQHTSRRMTDTDEQYTQVIDVIIHDGYKTSSHLYDIALLKLQKHVEVSNGVNTICLPSIDMNLLHHKVRNSLECFVTGFGVNQMGRRPSIMQEAKVNLIGHEICRRPYVYGAKVADSMICAGHLEGGIDSCQGDSGGPLVCQNPEDGRWYQVGITSWGRGCGLPNRPGVYTSVPAYYEWVEKNIMDLFE